ncbi:hypothetical protein, partial [Roseovarius sp. MMSF_3350]|uniref:hypothetical protein n=1 Tax=Roseovarius sp. MMSF_3350 TaxID=3046706 RepID=UPI00273F4DFC
MKHEVIEHHNREALDRVLHIARQIDADGLSVEEKVNTALTFVVEASEAPIPLGQQRALLAQAVAALGDNATAATAAPLSPPAAPQSPARSPAP